MKKNDIVKLDIVSVTSEGNGVAKENEFVFFIPYAIEGETVNAKILKIKKNIVYCKLIDVLTPSKHRISPLCDNFYKCGGCTYLNMSYEKQLKYKLKKINDSLLRIGKLDLNVSEIIPSPLIFNYRNKALIPVSEDKNKNPVCGFYRNFTHDVIDMDICHIQDEDAFKIANTVKKWMKDFNIEPYNELTKKGLIRHIYFRKGLHSKEIMAGLVATSFNIPHIKELKDTLINSVDNLKSIIINKNEKNTNVILGEDDIKLYGEPYITDNILDKKFKIGPKSFFQVNPYNVGNLYKKALDLLKLNKDDVLFDIYCGIGTIGICAADKVKEVVGVEIIPEAIKYAKENALLNNLSNTKFYVGKAEELIGDMILENNKPTKVILDPPRSGCKESLINEIIKLSPERICYVSCDAATLARDLKIFKDSGVYTIKEIVGCDMFPNTFHVETVALLTKLKESKSITVELNLDELEVSAPKTKTTYSQIKEYVLNKYGFKVSSLNIAQVKSECGIIERENYNKPSDDYKQPNCPKHKADAIKDAFGHFRMFN